MNFKVGSSVKRTIGGSYPTYGLIVGDTYIIEGIVDDEDGKWLALKGVLGVGNDPHQWDAECFELVKEEREI